MTGQSRTANDIYTDIAPFLHDDRNRAQALLAAQGLEGRAQEAAQRSQSDIAREMAAQSGLTERAKIVASAKPEDKFSTIALKKGLEGEEVPYTFSERTGRPLPQAPDVVDQAMAQFGQLTKPEEQKAFLSSLNSEDLRELQKRMKAKQAQSQTGIRQKVYGE